MNKLGSSRQHIQIKQVKDGVLILPHNHYRIVLETSALNFELNSDEEQDVLLDTFQHFLNALPCSVQILIRTRELDVDDYLQSFQEKKVHEAEPLYKEQLSDYCSFVQKLVAGNRILSRRFYIVIPYEADPSSKDFSIIKEHLQLQQEVINRELEKIGIKTHQLSSLEVLQLFYSFYNPKKIKTQPLTEETIRTIETSTL